MGEWCCGSDVLPFRNWPRIVRRAACPDSCASLAADAPPAPTVVALQPRFPARGLAGPWLGGLNANAGMTLRLALDVTQTDGKLTAILDSIDQNAKIPITTISVNANDVQFECASIAGSFEGSLAR